MIDLEQLDLDVRMHIAAAVPAIAKHDTAEILDEELSALLTIQTPAILTMIDEESQGRTTIGSKKELHVLHLRVGLVTRSLATRSAALRGTKGSLKLRQDVKKAVVGWKHSAMLRAWQFKKTESKGRIGDRVVVEMEFEATAEETYS